MDKINSGKLLEKFTKAVGQIVMTAEEIMDQPSFTYFQAWMESSAKGYLDDSSKLSPMEKKIVEVARKLEEERRLEISKKHDTLIADFHTERREDATETR